MSLARHQEKDCLPRADHGAGAAVECAQRKPIVAER
jgi:hypothetical protein